MSLPVTPAEFRSLIQAFTARLESDTAFAELMTVICGGRAKLNLFTNVQGVSISPFAALMNLPVSTVRHYQRLGLIVPYEVNGKFRFWVHNVIQCESVRQWRDLGLTLEDIQAQRSQERLGGQSVTMNTATLRGMNVLVTEKVMRFDSTPSTINAASVDSLWLPLQVSKAKLAPHHLFSDEEDVHWSRLLEEVSTARQKLERHLHTLEQRVERARALEAALQKQTPGRKDRSR